MNSKENYIFWRLADFFISKQDYRLIQMKADDKELWLENIANKNSQIIRLVRHDLDWSNWMQRDIETTAELGERFRKRYVKGELQIINLYVTPFPPVDDYQYRIEKAFQIPGNEKTYVTTILIVSDQLEQSLGQLTDLLGGSIDFTLQQEFDEIDIQSMKQSILAQTAMRAKKERAMFENGKPLFTYVILAIQIVVFLLMEVKGSSTSSSTLIQFGAKINPLILDGEWWRFLTPIFLHIGTLHLLMNSIALFYVGPLVERLFGNGRFIFIYLFAGFSGSLASFVTNPNLSAGASGAIFGCFGALLYFGTVYPKLFFRTMGMNLLIVIGLNIIFGFSVQGIDNAGHIGGLVGGFLAAGIVHFPKVKKALLQLLFFVVSGTIVAGGLFYGFGETTRAVDVNSSLVLADMYVDNGEYDRAYSILTEAVTLDKKTPELLFQLSYVEIKKGMTDQAKEHLQSAIKMDPSFHEALYNLALIYLSEQELEKANELAQEALKNDPDKSQYKNLVEEINKYLAQ